MFYSIGSLRRIDRKKKLLYIRGLREFEGKIWNQYRVFEFVDGVGEEVEVEESSFILVILYFLFFWLFFNFFI